MSCGLELRSPFLDHRVAEFCLALDDHHKVSPRSDKLVLRDAMAERVTPAARHRDKQGFSGPMAAWMADPGVTELWAETLGRPASRIFDLLEHDGLDLELDGRLQAQWNLLLLALWAEGHAGVRR